MRIKICGIKTPELAQVVVDCGADAIGLNFVTRSLRSVTSDEAQQILQTLSPWVEPVALFADASTEQVMTVAKQMSLRTIQLHGNEPVSYGNYLSPLRVIKALAFDDQFADQVAQWQSGCANLAAILVDAPPAAGLTGGTGQTIDWVKLAQMKRDDWPPLILAGGLTPLNVAQAIEVVKPYGVDVASGVEKQRGIKDSLLIQAFCQAVHDVAI